MTYRKATAFLNRIRWQTEYGTPMTTLANIVETEGTKVQQAMNDLAEQVFTEHHFEQTGAPRETGHSYGIAPEKASLPMERIAHAIEEYNRDKAEGLRIDSTAANQLYENPDMSVNVSIDDVGVKKQKETGRTPTKTRKESREYVHNTIAHVEKQKQRYILNGTGNESVLRLLIAFLLHNGLLQGHYVQFFVDGARSLHAAILSMFHWLPHFRIILDWYHLEKKCEYELSLALKGSKIRNTVLEQLLPLLWLGKVDAAIAFLQNISMEYLKAGQSVERLIGYFQRNRDYIPCYALRKQLGLRNSSNKGEKANDLCVASRQKHNGMSWSKPGSIALATVTAMHINKEQDNWFSKNKLDFKLVS